MAAKWPTARIGDVAEIFDGPHATPKKASTGPIFLGIAALDHGRLNLSNVEHLSEEDFIKWTRRVTPRAGDVVFSYETRLGEAALIPDELRCCLGRRMGLVRSKEHKLDSRFFLYQYLSPAFQAFLNSRTVHGSTVDRISLIDFPDFPIVLPTIEEQRAIADILGTLDDKIELNRRMNETLEAIARAIFKSWFVDFDPVRAKANGEPPESICRRLGLTPDLLALFPDGFQDSELGMIPEGWEISTVSAVTAIIFSGGTPDTRRPEYWDGNLNWFSSGETRNNFVVGTEKRITQVGVDNSSTRLAVPGDVLIASAGQGNTRGQVSYSAIHTYINQSVVSLRAKAEAMSPPWLFYNLSSRYEEMRSISDSHSSRGSLTTKLIGGMPIIDAGAHLVNAFSDLIKPLMERQIANQLEVGVLSETRDALLPGLLSGELPVPVELLA